MPLSNLLGELALDDTIQALLAEFRNKYDAVRTARALYSTPGIHDDPPLILPPAGQAVRLTWLYVQARASVPDSGVLVTVSLDANSYQFELIGSQPFMHSAVWEGATNSQVIVETSNNQPVLVNADYRLY